MTILYIIVFLFGLVIGSFINVMIYRIPVGKSIAVPPSACMACGKRLAPIDLIPVLSYFFLKGRCRYCGAAVSPRYPLVELLTGVIFVLLFAKYGFTVPFFAFIYLMTLLIAVLFIDYDHRIIPDELVIAGIAAGILITFYNGFKPMTEIYGDSNWWTPVAGFFSSSGFLLLIAILGLIIYKDDGAMGMGDVKLMAPIGLFLGWKLCLTALFIGIILGGLLSLFLVVTRLKKRKDAIPFGPFLVTGTFVAIIWGWDILNWYIGTV